MAIRGGDQLLQPLDADLVSALASLGMAGLVPPPRRPEVDPVDDPGALLPTSYGDFFRGIRT